MSIRPIRLIGLISLIIIFFFRIFFYFSCLPNYPTGTKLRISARVSSEPVIYSDSQYLKLSGYKIYLPLYPRVYYGDRLVVEGVVEEGKLKKPKLIQINDKRGILFTFRQKLISFYERSLPADHSAIVAGVVIGSKSGIGEALWEKLKNSGTAHIVVASGMNVSMVSQFLIVSLIVFMPRRKAIVFALIGIWLYALISGFDAPIVRATVMGSMAFLAVETGRIYQSLRILLVTAMMLLFFKPI